MNVSLTPKLEQFVKKQVKDGLYKDSSDVVRNAVRLLEERNRTVHGIAAMTSDFPSNFLQNEGDGDIEAMAFVVLMQATQDMDKDLKMIMAEVKSMTAAKQKLRDLISKVNKDISSNAAGKGKKRPLSYSTTGMTSEQAYHKALVPIPDTEMEGGVQLVETDLYSGNIDGIEQLKSIQGDLKGKLDGMNEISEMASLRLQMMMDRRSKFISTLSNIMKKISTTQDTLVQNLK